jgi:hypothetical protein
MKNYCACVMSVFIALVYRSTLAEASPDPCYLQGRNLSRAESAFSLSETRLAQAQDRLARLQDQIASRRYSYQTQISQAQANASAVTAISSGVAAQCAVRAIFGFGYVYCVSSSMASRIGAQARARANINAAISRSNAYNTYAQGALYREGLRVTIAQDEYNTHTSLYQNAQAAYDQCRIGVHS